jgi:hypothetical protein
MEAVMSQGMLTLQERFMCRLLFSACCPRKERSPQPIRKWHLRRGNTPTSSLSIEFSLALPDMLSSCWCYKLMQWYLKSLLIWYAYQDSIVPARGFVITFVSRHRSSPSSGDRSTCSAPELSAASKLHFVFLPLFEACYTFEPSGRHCTFCVESRCTKGRSLRLIAKMRRSWQRHASKF